MRKSNNIFKKLLAVIIILTLIVPLFQSVKVSAAGNSAIKRDTVLLLDMSGSMYGTPISVMKDSAKKFCEKVLAAEGNNRIALVIYDHSYTSCDFTSDYSVLESKINSIYSNGGTDINQALKVADNIMENGSDDDAIKNIVLLTDGVPEHGESLSTGQYTYSEGSYSYSYANAAYETAKLMKDKYYIYTLGFFHRLSGDMLNFAKKFLNDIQNAGYYEVINSDELEFVFGEIGENIISLKKTGTFKYCSGVDKDYSSTYYYDDEYFANSSYQYNQSLATMTLCLAMSAFASNEQSSYAEKSCNARDLLQDIGFNNFDKNEWYTKKPTKDSIGVVAANKLIKANNEKYTLIAVAVRGAGYESEWASNFTIGSSGQHQGFNEAKNNVLSFLKEYIKNNNIEGKIKIWITGFSRAAATSNLVAGELDKGYSLGNTVTLEPQDLYAYCFEAPAGALRSEVKGKSLYKNIFNIINYNDPVPKVAPRDLGFGRYGADKYLPEQTISTNYSEEKSKMLEKYYELDSTDSYIVDNFIMKKISVDVDFLPTISIKPTIKNDNNSGNSQNQFLDSVINKLVKENIKSRDNYVNKYQDGVREVFGILEGVEDEQWDKFEKSFNEKIKDNIGWIIASTIPAIKTYLPSTISLIEAYAVESLNEAGITSYTAAQVNKFASTMVGLIFSFAINHPNLTTTMICNIDGIGAAHYPELCLAWMQSMDVNYTTNAGASFNSGAYRIIRINCPVDVELYDKEGNLVANIIGDEPQDIDSNVIASINEDGEKLLYVCPSEDYSVKLIATDNGKVTYSINEYSSFIGDYSRIINYYEIPINKGDVLTGNISAYSSENLEEDWGDGTDTSYTLFDAKGNLISADIDIKGEDASAAYYMVNLLSENDEYGMVQGAGIRELGGYAQVTATPFEGYVFEGWYDNNNCVSTDSVYRFCVKEDKSLVAKFTSISPNEETKYSITIGKCENGSVSVDKSEATSGTSIKVEAKPDKGYKLEGIYVDDKKIDGDTFKMPSKNVVVTAKFIPSKNDVATNTSSKNNKTGDNSNYGYYLMLIGVSFMILKITRKRKLVAK